MITPPPPLGDTWTTWGERLNDFLKRNMHRLQFLRGGETASDDGILVWDPAQSAPAVSRDGEFVALRYGHSDHCLAYTNATHSAASTNTAYAITWENNPIAEHIAVDDTTTSRIVFEHAGTYKVDFSCELLSSNSSSKSIYIWPRINGTDVPFSTIVTSIDSNNNRLVTSRSGIFTVDVDDYLEAMFAVTDTAMTIDGSAATAFAPASPSATIIVTEVEI